MTWTAPCPSAEVDGDTVDAGNDGGEPLRSTGGLPKLHPARASAHASAAATAGTTLLRRAVTGPA